MVKWRLCKKNIVIASGNSGKVREIRAALRPLAVATPSLADLSLGQVAEPHATFMENALAKARAAAAAAKTAAVADDSGLVVPALGGCPGVHSSRYAGAGATDAENNRKLLAAMREIPQRRAFYYAAMIFVAAAEDPAPVFAEGYWCGEILAKPRGRGGFGYDSVFFDPAAGKTGAQMSLAEKNAVSHRGRSLRELMRLLAQRYGA